MIIKILRLIYEFEMCKNTFMCMPMWFTVRSNKTWIKQWERNPKVKHVKAFEVIEGLSWTTHRISAGDFPKSHKVKWHGWKAKYFWHIMHLSNCFVRNWHSALALAETFLEMKFPWSQASHYVLTRNSFQRNLRTSWIMLLHTISRCCSVVSKLAATNRNIINYCGSLAIH